MKRCCNCEEMKELQEFGKLKKAKDGLQYRCKDCQREYDRAHYKNSDSRKVSNKASDKRRRNFAYNKLKEMKLSSGCVDCGYNENHIALQFDHTGDKHLAISTMVKKGYAWSKIKAETEKCEVRCSNCHIIKTAKQFDWYNGDVD